ncbi:uncharacterized protein LOC119191914, partial [Manduca sexta]|uniref:uncharacterized protein LOC119191914 n=1 Tax=Manduca sexta TaxID=7130 RepID=UPI00188EDDF6
KTILSGDKIQCIIQNLSLDKTELLTNDESKLLDYEVKPIEKIKQSQNEKLLNELNKIHLNHSKKISNDFNIVNNDNIVEDPVIKKTDAPIIKKAEESIIQNEEDPIKKSVKPIIKKLEESIITKPGENPLHKRLQKQSGIPAGINFGSLIGELKSKTRNASNGGLKPVFKKFDAESDAVDSVQDTLNSVGDDKKKVHIDENELGSNILADRRNKLETAAQGWRKRVPQNDATLFTVAGRLERDKVTTNVATPPLTPPNVASPMAVASPGIPPPNTFRSRKQPSSPTKNGFPSGPLRSASYAVVSAAAEPKPRDPRPDRDSFKRSHSVSESISRVDEKEDSPGAERSGCPVRVPRADDETFQAFFAPLQQQERSEGVEVDLDAIDSGSRQLLASEWSRRARRERRHAASRNPLKALAARADIREEYVPPPSTNIREQLIKEKGKQNAHNR